VTKKKEIAKKEAQQPSEKRFLTILTILVILIAFGSIVFFLFLYSSEVVFSLNAAIIDQLGEEFPNPSFVENVTSILETHGFNVSYYNETLDVNFFKELAKNNYGIIILRVHSALREDNSTVDLFTSEKYDYEKYSGEREDGLLTMGEYLYSPGKYYFAVTPLFIQNLEGRFPKSVVIAMGCWSLKPECEQMAMAFVDKGAKAYVGWTDIVLPQDTDNETLRLLKMLLNENETLTGAITRTNEYTYNGTYGNNIIVEVHTRMGFYPQSAGNLKISELIAEAKISPSLAAFNNVVNFYSILIIDTSERRRIQKEKASLFVSSL
jgi:hypothetical protein